MKIALAFREANLSKRPFRLDIVAFTLRVSWLPGVFGHMVVGAVFCFLLDMRRNLYEPQNAYLQLHVRIISSFPPPLPLVPPCSHLKFSSQLLLYSESLRLQSAMAPRKSKNDASAGTTGRFDQMHPSARVWEGLQQQDTTMILNYLRACPFFPTFVSHFPELIRLYSFKVNKSKDPLVSWLECGRDGQANLETGSVAHTPYAPNYSDLEMSREKTYFNGPGNRGLCKPAQQSIQE